MNPDFRENGAALVPSLQIDGRRIQAKSGQTILDVCREHHIYVPSLCYHPRLSLKGSCRICLVEVENRSELQTACHTHVADDMVIKTNSPEVIRARRGILKLLLAGGHHNCMICETNGRCELQEIAYHLGIDSASDPALSARPEVVDASHPMIRFDPNKCIHCWRCIEACQEIAVNEVLHFSGRSSRPAISFGPGLSLRDSECVACGECVQLCPTGALMEAKSIGKGRPWQLDRVSTTCPYCGVGCQMELHVDRSTNTIVRVTGREGVPPNQGMLCIKGRFGYDFVSSPQRLKQPLVRRRGDLVPVSWNDALAYTSERLTEIRRRCGPDAISGVACARDTNENNYALMKFMRAVVGTNNLDHCART